jgi:hypothetical protein
MVFPRDLSWDHCFFLLYINDLPLIIKYLNINANPQTILFADDTSVIVSSQNNVLLENNLNLLFISVMKWFKANLLSLNLDKTYCMEFRPNYINNHEIQIKYNNKTAGSAIFHKYEF